MRVFATGRTRARLDEARVRAGILVRTLADRVRWLRRVVKHWSQRELALASGVNPYTILNVESGRATDVQWLTALRLADALGVPLHDLRGPEDACATPGGGGPTGAEAVRALGERLKFLRVVRARLRQVDLARLAHVTQQTVSDAERGHSRRPTWVTCCLLADALGVCVSDLRVSPVKRRSPSA